MTDLLAIGSENADPRRRVPDAARAAKGLIYGMGLAV
jgi:hypothetical protein